MNSPERINRREFLKRAVRFTVGAASFVALDACGIDITTPKTNAERLQWENLPAIDRLHKLIENDYPTFKDFNLQREITTATVQSYCEQVNCNMPPEKIIANIYYVDGDRFVAEYSDEISNTLTKEKAEDIKTNKNGLTRSNGRIYINNNGFEKNVKKMLTSQQNTIERIDKRTIETLSLVSVLSHELTHYIFNNINGGNEISVKIDGFPIIFLEGNPVVFGEVNGFKFKGKDLQGNARYITGGNESITDLAARIVVRKKMGIRYFMGEKNDAGSYMIAIMNLSANITDEEFLDYAIGERSSIELFERWGSVKINEKNSDLAAGLVVLGAVALHVDGFSSLEEAQYNIQQNFNVSF